MVDTQSPTRLKASLRSAVSRRTAHDRLAGRRALERLPVLTALAMAPGYDPSRDAERLSCSDDELLDIVMREALASLQRSVALGETALAESRSRNAEIEANERRIELRLAELEDALRRLVDG